MLYSKYNLIISPTLYYNIPALTLKYNTSYNIDRPTINPYGGYFSSINLPCGCILDKIYGNIQILALGEKYKINNRKFNNNNVAEIGNYNINITYTINNVTTSFIFYLNII